MDAMSGAGNKLGAAGWIAVTILFGLLAWAVWYGLHVWNDLDGVHMSMAGWIFLSLGVLVSLLVGCGLMALVFYSSRHDFDQ